MTYAPRRHRTRADGPLAIDGRVAGRWKGEARRRQTVERRGDGAWVHGDPGRRVRSRPRRAKEIRFVPVDIMGGRAPSPNM